MATCTILAESVPYYLVCVEFGDRAFEQLLVSGSVDATLQTQLQAYADEYEQEHTALINNL